MSMPTVRRRAALLAVGGVLMCWAYFNLNDPDGALWVAVYGTAGAASLLGAFGRLPRVPALALIIGAAVGAVVQAVRVVAEGAFIFGEQGREMLGLLIISTWTFVALRWSRRAGRAAERPPTRRRANHR